MIDKYFCPYPGCDKFYVLHPDLFRKIIGKINSHYFLHREKSREYRDEKEKMIAYYESVIKGLRTVILDLQIENKELSEESDK